MSRQFCADCTLWSLLCAHDCRSYAIVARISERFSACTVARIHLCRLVCPGKQFECNVDDYSFLVLSIMKRHSFLIFYVRQYSFSFLVCFRFMRAAHSYTLEFIIRALSFSLGHPSCGRPQSRNSSVRKSLEFAGASEHDPASFTILPAHLNLLAASLTLTGSDCQLC